MWYRLRAPPIPPQLPGMLRKSTAFRAAVPEVRIHLPPAGSQVRTCLWREFAFLRREAAVFRGCAAWASGAVGRDAPDAATSGRREVISLSGDIPVPHRRSCGQPNDSGGFEFGSGG